MYGLHQHQLSCDESEMSYIYVHTHTRRTHVDAYTAYTCIDMYTYMSIRYMSQLLRIWSGRYSSTWPSQKTSQKTSRKKEPGSVGWNDTSRHKTRLGVQIPISTQLARIVSVPGVDTSGLLDMRGAHQSKHAFKKLTGEGGVFRFADDIIFCPEPTSGAL